MQVLRPREVPLGGVRALPVRRTLPHRDRPFVGAWCFADHYGPVPSASSPMRVLPHPHTGLATVSWLFAGEIEHRDSDGVVATVRAGELNLMTSGHGIAHSEMSSAEHPVLHGVQLWVALPDAARDGERAFAHHAPSPVRVDGATVRVFLGSLAGESSPVVTATPLLGAQLDLDPGARVHLDVDPGFEHAVLLDVGAVSVDGVPLAPGDLGCLDAGPGSLDLAAGPDGTRVVLLGGEPFEEDIVMWWNVVGRTPEDVAVAREQWQARADRFGAVPGWPDDEWIPAPPLPGVRLRPRGRR